MKPSTLSFLIAPILLAACASPPAPTEVLSPSPQLVTQGIPPVPASLAREVAQYTDFRGHRFIDWHPTKREMLVAHRKGNTAQLFRVADAGSEPEQLTDFPDPVTSASYEPRDGRYVVFERSAGGSEAARIYRLDVADRRITPLTDETERTNLQGWLRRSGQLLVASLPLDKTAQGGTRKEVTTTFRLIDPMNPQSPRRVAELPGGGWFIGGVSNDEKQVSLTRYVSINESEVWTLDLASGRTTQLLPAPGSTARSGYLALDFMAGDAGVFVLSDHASEFKELMAYRFADRALTRMTAQIPWDVSNVAVSRDGARVAATVNIDGRSELRLFDGRTLQALATPAMPPGSIDAPAYRGDTHELAFSLDSARGPSQIYGLADDGTRTTQWTRPYAPPGVDMSRFVESQVVRWKSFDGRTISGLMTLPPARYTGKRPVLVAIHGGPEAQATVGFMNRLNYYVNELGIAIIEPNVRGSSGFGKTFQSLDDGRRREDSVKDIGALFDWIATQPQLDASRVVVTGGSYGGYMSLAVSTHYADRIAGSIDIVGISNFVTFLQNTESYRRDLRRVEYGDEREPAMRDFLTSISPLTNAKRITKPLFVVQGRNDPRVPYTEAEQMVAQARANGTPVWYLLAENEGHGFARKENADYQFYATILFLKSTLGIR